MTKVAVKDVRLKEIDRYIIGNTNTSYFYIKDHDGLAEIVKEAHLEGQEVKFITKERTEGTIVL